MNNENKAAAARLDDVETRIAHQERMIADLNDVITKQWRKIDQLERQLSRMKEELQSIEPQRTTPEPPPPHY
jgi:SlyX protein